MLAACRVAKTDTTPVWFMRQAGRCLPDYRKLRQRHAILEIARTPELAARVSLMPVEQLGVDGAVIFADIVLPIAGMGVGVDIVADVGPVIERPIRSIADVERLRPLNPEADVPFVLDAIRMIRQELNGRAAVIGFAGAPFTLACYLIEGRPSRDFTAARAMMFGQPDLWVALMDRLTDATIVYLKAQVTAGAQVVQLFDSWGGSLSPADYARSVLPWNRRIFDAVRETGVPSVSFATANAHLLDLTRMAGSDVVSIDWRVDFEDAWRRFGYDRAIQGNLDSARPVAGWEPTLVGARELMSTVAGRPGHIFNLGHGVMPDTDPDVLRRLVDFVHTEGARS
ncbi:MAG: uroporphyrinogen decarboxylase [Chloroflexota bacterium]|nr:MAG: uroporphyrinogen decarboxylase [Chloroflexota bacterium]